MYINLMQWFRDFEHKARQDKDTRSLQLIYQDRLGWRMVRAVRYTEAQEAFERGIQIAQKLDEHGWVAVLEYAVCYVCQQDGRYDEMLDRAVKLVAKMGRPELQHHPYRAAIHQMLVRVYAEIDICGYKQEMTDAMNFIEKNIPMDRVTHMSIYYRRINLLLYFEEYEDAHDLIQEYISVSTLNPEQKSVAYRLLAQYYFATGKVSDALEAQLICAKSAGVASNMRWEALAIGLQAMLLGWLGRTTDAYNAYMRGKNLLEGLHQDDLVHALEFGYLYGCGRDEDALIPSGKALEVARKSGSLDRTFEWHIARCYLLNRLGKPIDDEVVAARELIQQFRTPDCHEKKLARVENGRCYPHDWQNNQLADNISQSDEPKP